MGGWVTAPGDATPVSRPDSLLLAYGLWEGGCGSPRSHAPHVATCWVAATSTPPSSLASQRFGSATPGSDQIAVPAPGTRVAALESPVMLGRTDLSSGRRAPSRSPEHSRCDVCPCVSADRPATVAGRAAEGALQAAGSSEGEAATPAQHREGKGEGPAGPGAAELPSLHRPGWGALLC